MKYETIDKVQLIQKRLDSFAELEHIDQLKNVLLPKVKNFGLKIDDFFESNIEMRECIKKFDVALSMKANKEYLTIFEAHLDTKYIL